MDWVDLTHAALRDDRDGQMQLADSMQQKYPHLEQRNLQSMSFIDALKIAKANFHSIPKKSMRPSLVAYMERTLNYLSPGVVVGVGTLVQYSGTFCVIVFARVIVLKLLLFFYIVLLSA